MSNTWDAERIDRTGKILLRSMNGFERKAMSSFFSGHESSRFERDELRAAINESTIDAELLEDIRYFFNFLMTEQEIMPRSQIAVAIRIVQGKA